MKAQDVQDRMFDQSVCQGCDTRLQGHAHACPGGAHHEFNVLLLRVPVGKEPSVIRALRQSFDLELSLVQAQQLIKPALEPPRHPQRKAFSGVIIRSAVSKQAACALALSLEAAGAIVDLTVCNPAP